MLLIAPRILVIKLASCPFVAFVAEFQQDGRIINILGRIFLASFNKHEQQWLFVKRILASPTNLVCSNMMMLSLLIYDLCESFLQCLVWLEEGTFNDIRTCKLILFARIFVGESLFPFANLQVHAQQNQTTGWHNIILSESLQPGEVLSHQGMERAAKEQVFTDDARIPAFVGTGFGQG